MPDGKPTSQINCIKLAIGPLQRLYGRTQVNQFTPMAFKVVREEYIHAGVVRSQVNARIHRLRAIFRWGGENGLVSASVLHGLQAVQALRRGRSDAKESEPVPPVPDTVVEATLPFLRPVVAAMVQFQRLTGCRPDEVCQLRPCDIDRSADVWAYRPAHHKTQHHGRERVIFIGPKAQEILTPYLLRPAGTYCFSPREARLNQDRERRENRASPMTPSQANRRTKADPQRGARNRYDRDSYRRAIHRACELAFEMPETLRKLDRKADPATQGKLLKQAKEWRATHTWSPNQLRHTAATEIRKQFGLEAVQVVLGHAFADTSQIYAERDMTKAAAVIRMIG